MATVVNEEEILSRGSITKDRSHRLPCRCCTCKPRSDSAVTKAIVERRVVSEKSSSFMVVYGIIVASLLELSFLFCFPFVAAADVLLKLTWDPPKTESVEANFGPWQQSLLATLVVQI